MSETGMMQSAGAVRIKLAALAASVVGLTLGFALLFGGRPDWLWIGGVLLGFGAAGLAMSIAALAQSRPRRPAQQRYGWRMGAASMAYVALVLGAVYLHAAGLTKGPAGIAIALAPALPVFAGMAAVWAYLREETDELERRIAIEGMLWGVAVVMAGCTAWGLLETFGKAPMTPLWVVLPVFGVASGIGQGVARLRYR